MRIAPRALALLLSLATIESPARAITPAEEEAAQRGLDALYRNDYSGAEAIFRAGLAADGASPFYPLGYAVAAWWRMESRFALPGSTEEASFRSALDRAIRSAKEAVDKEETGENRLYLATGYGLRGRWRAANQRWFGAYLDGRRAYRNAGKAVRLDPGLHDAYLGIGAFNYYVATLSRAVRALAFASGGDREEGLRQLELAAARGRFSRVAAKLVLVGIHWTFEKKPQQAWSLLEEIGRQYPDSPMVLAMRLLGRFHLRDAEGLEREAREYLASAEAGRPHFEPIDRAVGRCFIGLARQLAGDPESALREYGAALAEVPANHRWRSVLLLFTGEALDLLDRREEAVASYRDALREPPLWGVARCARHRLRKPFRRGDDPLPDRNTEL